MRRVHLTLRHLKNRILSEEFLFFSSCCSIFLVIDESRIGRLISNHDFLAAFRLHIFEKKRMKWRKWWKLWRRSELPPWKLLHDPVTSRNVSFFRCFYFCFKFFNDNYIGCFFGEWVDLDFSTANLALVSILIPIWFKWWSSSLLFWIAII